MWRSAAMLLLLLPAAARADGDVPSATLPLAEFLRLHEAAEAPAIVPPVAATVTRLALSARVLERALDLTADVEVEVLADKGWAVVPLLAQDEGLSVTDLPRLDGATFAFRDGYLCLIAGNAGRHAFTLGLLKQAVPAGARRRVELAFAGATFAVLRLRSDETLFRLDAPGALQQGDARVLYPQGRRFVVEWEQTARAGAAIARAARPPIDPVIPLARASVVGTLAGARFVRVRYDLRFEGPRTLRVQVPPMQTVTKVFVNGAPVAFALAGGTLALPVAPARAGDQDAAVELVLTEPTAPYHLSGTLALAFPQPDWPVHEMYATVHLPDVFDYAWAGGSLAVTERAAPAAEYAYALPTPGKALVLHQELVAQAPTVRVDYDVDLTGRYFR